MSALSDKIKSDLIKLSKSNGHLQSIIKRLESGNANLSDVDYFAQATGAVLKKVFEKSITESPKAFTDEQLIAEILGDIFGDNYELINSVAENIQKQLDKAAGIGIKPQRADFPSERIENLAKVTAQKDLTDKTALSEFTASVENINGSIFTDYVKTNADFRSKAGLRVYVIRSDHSKCCAWCSKLAGKYVYPDVPKDIWRRHKRCTCEITYVNEKIGTYDQISYSDVQNGKEIETRKQVTRLTPEQARAKEKEVLKRLDKRGGSGIIKMKDIPIGKSIGAKAKNYDILDPQTGEYFNFVEGTKIQNPKVFAGKGGTKPLNPEVADGLSKQIGGKPENWQHLKGIGVIDYYGEEVKAEVHWFQEESVGKHKFKVKRWLDNDD